MEWVCVVRLPLDRNETAFGRALLPCASLRERFDLSFRLWLRNCRSFGRHSPRVAPHGDCFGRRNLVLQTADGINLLLPDDSSDRFSVPMPLSIPPGWSASHDRAGDFSFSTKSLVKAGIHRLVPGTSESLPRLEIRIGQASHSAASCRTAGP